NGDRVALDEFVTAAPRERVMHERSNGLWFRDEPTIARFTMDDVLAGFTANPDLHIRTQELTSTGEKVVLTRQASLAKLQNEGIGIIEGANLKHNEYGHPLFANY